MQPQRARPRSTPVNRPRRPDARVKRHEIRTLVALNIPDLLDSDSNEVAPASFECEFHSGEWSNALKHVGRTL